MHIQMQEVQQLIQGEKYKKALGLLKKINRKSPTCQSLDLEGMCLFNTRSYGLALTRYHAALKAEPRNKNHANLYTNIAACHIKQDDKEQAISALIQGLELDGSPAHAGHRLQLGQLATQTGQHELVLEHLPKLLTISEHAHNALYLLLNSSLALAVKDKVAFYSAKLLAECNYLSSLECSKMLELLVVHNKQELAQSVLSAIKLKHEHEKWYQDYRELLSPSQKKTAKFPKPPKDMIVGKDKKLKVLIEELIADNVQQGARFHDAVRIFADDGNLSIKGYIENKNKERLLDIPLQCMPLMSDYKLSIDDNEHIVAEPKGTMENPNAANTMALMVKIYNQTNKIKTWKQQSPYFALQSKPDVLNKLLDSKVNTHKVAKFKKLLDNQQYEQLALDSFFGSRTFSYNKETLAQANIHIQENECIGLLSIIDFLNHKVGSSNYQITDDMLYYAGQPEQETQEMMVHYNNFDPLMTYLLYGFVDTSSPWLFSIPLLIGLSNGAKIALLGNSGRIQPSSYSKSADFLADYLPNITQIHTNDFGMDKLVIPGSANKHLYREALTIIIKSVDKNEYFATDAKLTAEVIRLEKETLRHNITYWRELKEMNEGTFSDIDLLCDTATKHINGYASSVGVHLF